VLTVLCHLLLLIQVLIILDTSHLPSLLSLSSPDMEQLKDHRPRAISTLKSLGFAFSPAGLLFPYQLGVAKFLIERNLLKSSSPLVGASAGALIVVAVALELDFDELLGHLSQINAELMKTGARHYIWHALKRKLNEILPEDCHTRLNSRKGSVGIAVTYMMPLPTGEVIREFRSKADVIQILMSTCNVPMWFTWTPTVSCRGWPSVDGFFGQKKGTFGCPNLHPEYCKQTLRITPILHSEVSMTANQPGDIISPELDSAFKMSINDQLQKALNPFDDQFLQEIYNTGYGHAEIWLESNEAATFLMNSNEDDLKIKSHKILSENKNDGSNNNQGKVAPVS